MFILASLDVKKAFCLKFALRHNIKNLILIDKILEIKGKMLNQIIFLANPTFSVYNCYTRSEGYFYGDKQKLYMYLHFFRIHTCLVHFEIVVC